jgi:hypothetical protein
MDLALAIEKLVPSAEYFGSTFDNTEDCYDALDWKDERPKPTFTQLKNAWKIVEQDLETKKQVKEAALAKLEALGLTTEDLKALGF